MVEIKKSFYRVPKVIINQDDRTQELSKSRRDKWLSNISRDDIKPSSVDNIRICSDHFISGEPSKLYDHLNPDWAPTVKMGHSKFFQSPPPSDPKFRYGRMLERSEKKKKSDAAAALLDLQNHVDSDCECEAEVETGQCTQTSIDLNLLTSMESELQRLTTENTDLKEKTAFTDYTPEYFINDDEKVKYYTGLPNYNVLMALYKYLEAVIPQSARSVLSKFQQLVFVLMKLRLNLSMQDLSYRFKISLSTASRTFLTMIDIMHVKMKSFVHWPEREALVKTMPMSFRTHFGTKVAVVLDCFEIFIDRPSNLMARTQTWSQYKHHNTAKYLIGISPQGVISFISKGWGGRVSDKHITENCGILAKLLPGDVVLADRGFDIADSVGMMCAEINIPCFTRGKKQLSAREVEYTRKIATVRIHVERVIGVVRQKYTILQGTIPIDFLQMRDGRNLTTLDKIVHICCALTNLCDSVVSSS